jgi:hypothetical protein
MDLAVNSFDDDIYENMTYDERRNFNLARNRDMMNLLFASEKSLLADEQEETVSPSLPSVLADVMPNEADPETLTSNMTINIFF